MTKKDYELIAGSIKEVYEYQKDSDGKGSGDIKRGAIEVIISNLASSLAWDNPRFDRDRFIKACMPE